VANSEILLAVTMWLTWAIRPDPDSSDVERPVGDQLSSVSFQRLKELGVRLAPRALRDIDGVHQLVRFNLYNFGEQPVVVCAMELPNVRDEILHCDVVPSIVVAAGARYPMMVEVLNGPIQEVAQIAVDINGQRVWVETQSLPKS
jgi:hypothetical protein